MTHKKGQAKRLDLAKVLDLNEATVLHGKLMSMRGSDIIIDASAVDRIGALCAQVLMAGAKSWEQDDLSFGFSKVSDAFARTMQLIGINCEHLMVKESGK